MSILVSGSVAFDHIMVFPDRFKNHILPEKLHVLNVSFNITSLKTHFGGVAGNIAYHLRLLGDDPADPRDGRPRLRALRGVARPPPHPPPRDPGLRRHPHAAGLRHHGPRRQPDLGLLRGRDRARPRGARRGRARAALARDRLLERQAGDGRARAGAQGARRADADRSQPRAADPLRRRALRDDPRRGGLRRQRLRMGAHARAHRKERAGDRGGLRGRDHHQGRAGLDDPRGRARDRDPAGARGARSSTRPAAATPIAPVCCTRAPSAGPGRSPVGSGACSAPTRSRSREPRTRRVELPALRARFEREFGMRLPLMENGGLRALAQARPGCDRVRRRAADSVDRAPPLPGSRAPGRVRGGGGRPRDPGRRLPALLGHRARRARHPAGARDPVPRAGERAARVRGRPALRLEGRQGSQLRPLRRRQHDGREPAADRARAGPPWS